MKQEKIGGLVILVLLAFAVLIVRGQPIRVAGHTILGSHPTKYGLDIGAACAPFCRRTPSARPAYLTMRRQSSAF